jgi:peptidoglycan-associated lipoprotein
MRGTLAPLVLASMLAACGRTSETGSLKPSPIVTTSVAISSDAEIAEPPVLFTVYFDTDDSHLPQNTALLMDEADWLSRHQQILLMVEGHADDRGSTNYNIDLALRRANAVRNFLIDQGIDGGRISAVSYGKESPIESGTSDYARQLNRCAISKILDEAAPSPPSMVKAVTAEPAPPKRIAPTTQ